MIIGSSKDRFFVSVDVSAKDPRDDQRLRRALSEITVRDLQVSINSHPTGAFHTVEGESTSQLESICNRLRNQYLAIIVDGPKPVFLETFREDCEVEGKYIQQVGGSGNYGHCRLHIEPSARGRGYSFISMVPRGLLLDEYVKSIERGVQIAMQSGGLHGHPIVDLNVTLIDASYHAEDSNPTAFEIAGSTAFLSAVKKADLVLLEPVVSFEIEVGGWYMEEIKHEVTRRHGRVEKLGKGEITATLPFSELLTTSFKELGAFTMRLAGYEPVRGAEPPDEDASGVTANNPKVPRPRSGSEAVRPEEG